MAKQFLDQAGLTAYNSAANTRTTREINAAIEKLRTDVNGAIAAKVASLFRFVGRVDNVLSLPKPTAELAGAVYQVGDLEYACNGTEWVELGKTVDLTEVNKQIADLQAKKVDKIAGKGLSANDFTTAEKNRLAEKRFKSIGIVKPGTASTQMNAGALESFSLQGDESIVVEGEATAEGMAKVKFSHKAKHAVSEIAVDDNNQFISKNEKNKLSAIENSANLGFKRIRVGDVLIEATPEVTGGMTPGATFEIYSPDDIISIIGRKEDGRIRIEHKAKHSTAEIATSSTARFTSDSEIDGLETEAIPLSFINSLFA